MRLIQQIEVLAWIILVACSLLLVHLFRVSVAAESVSLARLIVGAIAAVYAMIAAGLLLRKEWARKAMALAMRLATVGLLIAWFLMALMVVGVMRSRSGVAATGVVFWGTTILTAALLFAGMFVTFGYHAIIKFSLLPWFFARELESEEIRAKFS